MVKFKKKLRYKIIPKYKQVYFMEQETDTKRYDRKTVLQKLESKRKITYRENAE